MPQLPGFVSPGPAVVLGRVLTEANADVERRDEFGFLDRGRTPRIIEIPGVSGFPATWVTAPPWLGKTTVASGLHSWLQGGPTEFGELDDRLALTELGQPGADRDIPPAWWVWWLKEPEERPAVWIIDGLDEGADHDKRLLNTVLTQLETGPNRVLTLGGGAGYADWSHDQPGDPSHLQAPHRDPPDQPHDLATDPGP
jgi:hypothetical protein